jgi:predicted nucleic acid-binding protein
MQSHARAAKLGSPLDNLPDRSYVGGEVFGRRGENREIEICRGCRNHAVRHVRELPRRSRFDDITCDTTEQVRVVLDTSVLIAAFRSSKGVAAECVRLILLRKLTILMDYKLACEYRDVALRSEQVAASGKTREETELLLDMLEAVAEPVMVIVRHRPFSPDANADMVLDVAFNGNPEAIASNDTKHFREPLKLFGLDLPTASELLREFRKRS